VDSGGVLAEVQGLGEFDVEQAARASSLSTSTPKGSARQPRWRLVAGRQSRLKSSISPRITEGRTVHRQRP
jgi:hypothetical protein